MGVTRDIKYFIWDAIFKLPIELLYIFQFRYCSHIFSFFLADHIAYIAASSEICRKTIPTGARGPRVCPVTAPMFDPMRQLRTGVRAPFRRITFSLNKLML